MQYSNKENSRFDTEETDDFYDRPSKSQRKRDMIALQKIGQTLVEESPERVSKVPMPDKLRDAINECQRIKHHEGRRRQLQFIGKIMRGLTEEEVQEINQCIERWQGVSRADTILMHAIENQREKLLNDDSALTQFVQQYPLADVQQLRALIRNTKKEKQANKPPKAYREIYRYLKQLMTQSNSNETTDTDANDD